MKDIAKGLDSLQIEQIEGEIDGGLKSANDHLLGSVKRLYYLERTGRYKENKKYKDSTFTTYLRFRYLMPSSLYHARKIAVLGHPTEVEKHGEAVVSIVRRRCGANEASRVFQEIEEIPEDKRSPHAIEHVITKHQRPRISANRSTIRDTRSELARLKTELLEARQTIRSLQALVDERDERIEKLVATVEKYKEEVAA